jgi:hypothetical protein
MNMAYMIPEERQRLAEAVKHHQMTRHAVHEQPEGASYTYHNNILLWLT